MEPMRKKAGKKNVFLVKTILLFLFAFIILIALFYVFSLMLPSLTGKCVATIDINYPLTVGGSPMTIFDPGYPSSDELAGAIRSVNARPDVGAVVFVMNSGGGSVVASGEVYDAVTELEKPSVSYFREVAASGAYEIAAGTDYIVSDPNALTGSIGVVTTIVSMEGMFEKIGVNATSVTSGDHKDMGSSFRNLTPEEEAILLSIVDEVFLEFRSIIVENRGDRLNMALFEEVLDGRILTGRQAKNVGLVDETGKMDDAILKAAQMAGIPARSSEEVRVCPVVIVPGEGSALSAEGAFSFLEQYTLPKLHFK